MHTLIVGQLVRFDGSAVDGSVSGFMDVRVIDPHSNAGEVTHVDGRGREYAGAFSHIRQAVVERPAYKDRPAKRFTVNTFTLRGAL